MKPFARSAAIAGVLLLLGAAPGWSQSFLSWRLRAAVEKAGPGEPLPVLVYFTDKGVSGKGQLNEALETRRQQFSPRALKRRAKMGLTAMTSEDLPVNADYVHRIVGLGARHRQSLNWFNASSFMMTGQQIEAGRGLSFIKRIELLPSRPKRAQQEVEIFDRKIPEAGSPKVHLLNYGPSFTQDSLINVLVCHDSGYSGAGVLVAMFDNGYRKNHQAFDSIRANGRLLDEWDFVTNADTVAWDSHGTSTWSLAGGYIPGQLIGPAYKASWAIYHTEDMSQEMPVEEDHWAAALQRADSIGADVVSSSLGYRDFVEDPLLSYTYEDLDGNTAISTLAARHAAALGIVVCNSMANSGPSPGTLAAPADADSMISVGATDSFGVISSYSSRGPTYDGRPKPEVCAQGTQTYLATWATTTSYGRGSGTSFATPLVAGASALILEAHPGWTPLQVREALMMTASRSATPDSTTYGWGVIDAWAAIHYAPGGIAGQETEHILSRDLKLSCRPNPVRGEAVIEFTLPGPGLVRLSAYDITGRCVYRSPAIKASSGRNRLGWKDRNQSGDPLSNGVYIFRVTGNGRSGTIKAVLIR